MKNTIYVLYCRLYQQIFRLVIPLLKWRKPIVIEGENSVLSLAQKLSDLAINKVLIITDQGLMNLGLLNGMLKEMDDKDVNYFIYDKTIPNPTIHNVEEALELYHKNTCQAIIAFGGGSPMDCAKVVGARVSRPRKKIPQLKGEMKVLFKIPTLFAIPTTAGTGSEVTIAAVISNSETHEKYAINDPVLIPNYAVLDPVLTVKLPPHITSTTGMDALTHAIEAYIGRSNTRETEKAALEAVRLIHENLWIAYSEPTNMNARAKMQKASFLGGVAFTRAYVGNVHAIAHTLGGFYGIPHGLANAVILPYVLKEYGDTASTKLAQLADHIKIVKGQKTDTEKAKIFIEYIENLNKRMNIPDKIDGVLLADIPVMAKRACSEANPLYPVPKIFFQKEMESMYLKIRSDK